MKSCEALLTFTMAKMTSDQCARDTRTRYATSSRLITRKGTDMAKTRPLTQIEIARRNAILSALDKIVTHELGDHWTLEAHMARKAALLEIINNNEGE